MNQDDNSNKIGVVAATLMVAGNMMGSGVFMLPANLAAIGGVAVFGWIVTCIGAIALALTFEKLSSIDPAAGGLTLIRVKPSAIIWGIRQTSFTGWQMLSVTLSGSCRYRLSDQFFPGFKKSICFCSGADLRYLAVCLR